MVVFVCCGLISAEPTLSARQQCAPCHNNQHPRPETNTLRLMKLADGDPSLEQHEHERRMKDGGERQAKRVEEDVQAIGAQSAVMLHKACGERISPTSST